jgi:hypothetical protein
MDRLEPMFDAPAMLSELATSSRPVTEVRAPPKNAASDTIRVLASSAEAVNFSELPNEVSIPAENVPSARRAPATDKESPTAPKQRTDKFSPN